MVCMCTYGQLYFILLWNKINKTYINAISSSFVSLLMQLHCCYLHSCTRTIEWTNKGCWCGTIKGGFCILGRHGWGKHICKNILPNIENMGWNFVPWGLCFACINDYLYRALKTLVYTHSFLKQSWEAYGNKLKTTYGHVISCFYKLSQIFMSVDKFK